MQTLSQTDVKNKVLKARIALALRQPFLASAIMRLPIKDASAYSWCKTMATDGYHIFYNEKWVVRLTPAELRGVLAHEVLHVIFQHGSRRSNRDAVRWNIASDHAINLLLLEQGFVLPAGGLADRRFLRKSAEIIYGLLPSNVAYKKGPDGPAADIGVEGDGVLSDAGLDLFDPDDVRTRAIRDVDAPDQSQLRELCEALRNDAKAKLHGVAAGLFQGECTAISEGRIDWRALLREWLQDRIKNDWSLWPFSKKHIHRGFMLPSVGIEAPGHIVFAIDTSGSMADEQLAQLFSEVRAYREIFPCQLTVIQADAAIQSVTTYDEMDGLEIPPNVTVVGRGGTDFRPVFRWIEEHAPSANLIYATDGFGTFPQVSSGGAVIWLLCRPHIEFDQVPFGVCVGLPN